MPKALAPPPPSLWYLPIHKGFCLRINTPILVRISLATLFALALVSKLASPSTLLDPLRIGLGLSDPAAALVFLLTVLALATCIGTLLLCPGPLGLFLSGAFFITGAAYAGVLQRQGWTGSCGCGVAPLTDSANPLVTHAYQNTACAVLVLFLGFRARPGGVSNEEAVQET